MAPPKIAPKPRERPRKITFIKAPGIVKHKMEVSVKSSEEKENNLFQIIFEQGNKRMLCLTKFREYFNDLKPGKTFFLSSATGINASVSKSSDKSGNNFCKYMLWLNTNVKIVEKGKRKSNKNLNSLQNVSKLISSRSPMNNLEVKNLKLNSVELHRYLGCETCTTSLKFPDENGKFICSKCPKINRKKSEKGRKIYGVARLEFEDSSGVKLQFVGFNSVCKTLLNANPDSFLSDNDANIVLKSRGIGSIVDVRFKAKKNKSCYFAHVKDLVIISPPEVCADEPQKETIVNLDNSYEMMEIVEKQFFSNTDSSPLNSQEAQNTQQSEWDITQFISTKDINYKLDPKRPGLGLIINFFQYKNESNIRHGSDLDINEILKFASQFGYELFQDGDREYFQDPKENFSKIIQDFKDALISKGYDSCILFLMAHGSAGYFENEQGKALNVWEHVIHQFSNHNFPQFSGKPKLFIVQACQGFKGVEDGTYRKKPYSDYMSDTLVVFSSLPGQMSLRDEQNGSPFIKLFVQFMDHNQRKGEGWNILQCVQYMQRAMGEMIFKYYDPEEERELEFKQLLDFHNIIFGIYKLSGNVENVEAMEVDC